MTATDPPQTLYRRVPSWLHRLGSGKVILVRRGTEPKAIQGIAVAVWLVLEQPATLDQLAAELTDFAPDTPPIDLDETISLLVEQGIIEAIPEST